MRLLVNLPPGFFSTPALADTIASLDQLGDVRRTACNTPDEIAPHLPWADAVLMWSWPMLTDELLDAAPSLRFSANLDIGQAGARILLRRGIPVSVARGAFSPAVAEMALGLILACLRRTSSHHAAMWAGAERWVESFPDQIDPTERELTGRRVGIVGFGAVGRRLAELLGPFRCPILAFDPHAMTLPSGVRAASLDELTAACEIVVLCAASNPDSRGLLGRGQIARLPQNAVLVNVARSALVDGAALLARLRRGDLFAAIDVFDEEPLPAGSPLRSLPNVYLTPHRAGGVMASAERLIRVLADDLAAWRDGRPVRHALTSGMLPGLDE